MAFIDKVIGPDEKLVGISTIHWMYAAIGIVWMAGFLMLGIYIDSFSFRAGIHFPGNPGLIATSLMAHAAFWICLVLGVTLFLLYTVMMATTEIGLTNKRIIYKRGWLFVKVTEADLEEVKAAGVNNGILGRLLNYGYIELDARFINNMNIPAIADPYRFVKAVNEIRSKLRHDSMTVVLDGHGDTTAVADKHAEPQQQRLPSDHVHKLEDSRYEALSNDPAKNLKDIGDEAHETMQRSVVQQSDMPPSIAPHPTTPPPASWTQGAESQAASQQPVPSAAPATTPPPPPAIQGAPQQTTDNKPSGPIVFEKENLKEELKEDILEDFSDGAKAKRA